MASGWDVVIIGGGGAGLSAAIEAKAGGSRPIVLEAAEHVGGSTAMSGGVYYAAGTTVQKSLGIEDSPDAMFEYYMAFNQWMLEPRVVRLLCDQSADGLDWLMSLGVGFGPEKLYASGVESTPRGHTASAPEGQPALAGGAGIISVLEREVIRLGIDVRCSSRATGLRRTGDGLWEVSIGSEAIAAPCVVIATGSFGHNKELVERLYPDAAVHGDWTWYMGAPHNFGDGVVLGESVGADVVGHNRGCLTETPNFRKVVEPWLPGWIVFVNTRGQRFVSELGSYPVLGYSIQAQPGNHCFSVMDHIAFTTAGDDLAYTDPYGLGVKFAENWTPTSLAEALEAGLVHRAEDLEGLARMTEIDPRGLVATVRSYNADVDAGSGDRVYLKPADVILPIRTPPFYAVEVRPATISMTFAGVRIDDQARVLDRAGEPIAGLFAAGETTGGVMGDRYIGGGNCIAVAVVYGRMAGRRASDLAKSSSCC